MFTIDNFVVDHFIRGDMFHSTTNKILWNITQIRDGSLSVTVDEAQSVDALDVPIITLERGKQAEFTAANAIFNLGLFAAQSGTEKRSATADATIECPAFEEFEVTADDVTTWKLPHAPMGAGAEGIRYIYKVSGNNEFAASYEYAASATTSNFTFTGDTITLPTDAKKGDVFFVAYDYLADGTEGNGAVEVDATAKNFPTAGKCVFQVLGHDPCDVSTKYFAYLIFPNSKLSSAFDLDFAIDANHPFTLKCMQDYCDRKKRLFRIVIPEVTE